MTLEKYLPFSVIEALNTLDRAHDLTKESGFLFHQGQKELWERKLCVIYHKDSSLMVKQKALRELFEEYDKISDLIVDHAAVIHAKQRVYHSVLKLFEKAKEELESIPPTHVQRETYVRSYGYALGAAAQYEPPTDKEWDAKNKLLNASTVINKTIDFLSRVIGAEIDDEIQRQEAAKPPSIGERVDRLMQHVGPIDMKRALGEQIDEALVLRTWEAKNRQGIYEVDKDGNILDARASAKKAMEEKRR